MYICTGSECARACLCVYSCIYTCVCVRSCARRIGTRHGASNMVTTSALALPPAPPLPPLPECAFFQHYSSKRCTLSAVCLHATVTVVASCLLATTVTVTYGQPVRSLTGRGGNMLLAPKRQ